MRPKDHEGLKERLQRRRRLILEASRRTAADIDALRGAERDPEMEEGSQSEQEQNKLSQLGEVEQQEIAQIDAALARLDAGRYGVCADCGDEIDERRLQALPFALACTECASGREKSQAVERQRAKRPRIMTPE